MKQLKAALEEAGKLFRQRFPVDQVGGSWTIPGIKGGQSGSRSLPLCATLG